MRQNSVRPPAYRTILYLELQKRIRWWNYFELLATINDCIKCLYNFLSVWSSNICDFIIFISNIYTYVISGVNDYKFSIK